MQFLAGELRRSCKAKLQVSGEVMSVYTLKEFKGLDHLHLFEGEITQKTPPIRCSSGPVSCCGKIKKIDYTFLKNEFACESEKVSLVKCVNSKSSICAACEAHLFKKFQEKSRR